MFYLIKVSVIVPAYNVGQYIEKCLVSLIKQTLQDIEIIVVNDGSTDNTLNIIEKYSRNDSRIKIIEQKNSGVSAARNNGLLAAKGKYIFQIDADDWIEPETLEEYYKAAEENNADITIANVYIDFGNGKIRLLEDGRHLSDDLIKELFLDNILPSVCAKFYKRELFVKNDIKFSENIRIGEDLLINFYLFFYAKKVIKIEKPFLHYMQRNNSIMKSYREQILDIYNVFEEIRDFLNHKKLLETYNQLFNFSMYFHTYFLRVLRPGNSGNFHKLLYKQYRSGKIKFENNPFIENFIKKQKLHIRFLEKLYGKSYHLGLFLSNFIILGKTLKNTYRE